MKLSPIKSLLIIKQELSWNLVSKCLLIGFLATFLTAGSCDIQVPPDTIHDPRFFSSGLTDSSSANSPAVAATAVFNADLFVGGRFTSIDDVNTNNIALFDTSADIWREVAGGGLINEVSDKGQSIVNAIVEFDRKLYVAGNFNRTVDNSVTNLNGIAVYDIDNQQWQSLSGQGLGPFPNVRTLELVGNKLYVGGKFSRTFDGSVANLNNIAVYDISNDTWSAVGGNGLDDTVYSFEHLGAELYVGGSFSNSFDGSTTNLNRIAILDTLTGNWSPLSGNGLTNNSGSGVVKAIQRFGASIYVGGDFSQTFDGTTTGLINIAEYQYSDIGGTWAALSGESDIGLNSTVETMAATFDSLFVGGSFTNTFPGSDAEVNNVARYIRNSGFVGVSTDNSKNASKRNTKSSKSAQPSGSPPSASPGFYGLSGGGLDNEVLSLAVSQNTLYIGGRFTETDDSQITNINGITGYDLNAPVVSEDQFGAVTNNWSQLGLSNGLGLNDIVWALAADASGNVYVGGEFSETADGRTVNLNSIGVFNSNTKTWSALANDGLNGDVYGLVISGNNLYVGGNFTATNDGAVTNLNNIARYDLTTATWSSLTGNGLSSTVTSVEIIGNNLYAGGFFTSTNDGTVTNLNNIARYDLTHNPWSPLAGNGVNLLVFALESNGTDLYVGGGFTRTFDSATPTLNRIALYDTTTDTWSALANNGLDGIVTGIKIVNIPSAGDILYTNGVFFNTGDGTVSLNRLAYYTLAGNSWSEITGNADVYQAAIDINDSVRVGNGLYIGGSFTGTARGVSQYLAHYYIQQWEVSATNTDWFDDANWTTGTPANDTNAFVPTGAGNINITSADVSLGDLILNGGTINVAVGRTLTINGLLGLKGGIINGAGTVIITDCTRNGIMGGSPTSYIQTALVRCVNDTGNFNFPVGSPSGYTPIQLSKVTGTGNFTVKASDGAFSGAASGLPTNRLQSFWDLTNGGITSADVRFNYQQSDIVGIESNYRAYRINGGTSEFIGGEVNIFKNSVFVTNVSNFSPWTLAELAPTASAVSVGGRVLTTNGQAISNAKVSVQTQSGEIRTVTTNPFGYYRFTDIMAGDIYIFSVQHKHYQFANSPRVISISDAVNDLNFITTEQFGLKK